VRGLVADGNGGLRAVGMRKDFSYLALANVLDLLPLDTSICRAVHYTRNNISDKNRVAVFKVEDVGRQRLEGRLFHLGRLLFGSHCCCDRQGQTQQSRPYR
jgi:hypothetical protein